MEIIQIPRYEEITHVQNQLLAIQEGIGSTLKIFKNRYQGVDKRYKTLIDFLNKLQKRDLTLQKYAEDLLKRELFYSKEKEQFKNKLLDDEKTQSSIAKSLGKRYVKLKEKLLLLKGEKIKISQYMENINKIIHNCHIQEKAIDQIHTQINGSLALNPIKISEVSNNLSKIVQENLSQVNYFKQVVLTTDEEIGAIKDAISDQKEKIDELSFSRKNINLIIQHLITIIDLTQKLNHAHEKSKEIKQLKHSINSQISQNNQEIFKTMKAVQKLLDEIHKHRIIERGVYQDSDLTYSHSERILSVSEIVHHQLNRSLSELSELHIELETKSQYEKELKESLLKMNELIESEDIESLQTQSFIDQTELKNQEIEQSELEFDATIERMQNELMQIESSISDAKINLQVTSFQTMIKDENQSSNIQLSPEVTSERIEHKKKQDILRMRIKTARKMIEELKKKLYYQKNFLAHRKAQSKHFKIEVETISGKLDKFNSIKFNLDERNNHSNITNLSKDIKHLSSSIEEKKKINEIKSSRISNYLSTISYYSLSPEPTFQKSPKFKLARDPYEEKKQTLNLLIDSLQLLQNRFEDIKDELLNNKSSFQIIQNWNFELDNLADDAEDLHIWNQVFKNVE